MNIVSSSISFKRGSNPYNKLYIGENVLLNDVIEAIHDNGERFSGQFVSQVSRADSFEEFFEIVNDWNFTKENFEKTIVAYISNPQARKLILYYWDRLGIEYDRKTYNKTKLK